MKQGESGARRAGSAAGAPGPPPGCVPECPGCPHRALARADSEARKQAWLEWALAPWSDRLDGMAGPGEGGRWGYRETVRLRTQWADGRWAFGLTRRETVIDAPDCPVHAPRVRVALAAMQDLLPAPPAFPMVWYLQAGAQVTLVVKTRACPSPLGARPGAGDALVRAGVEGLWLHLNPVTGRRRPLAKREWRLLWGRERSADAQALVHGPTAFRQLLPGLHERALSRAQRFLGPGPGDAVVDLYSGIGASLRRWSAAGARAVGVELSGEAVACAAVNAPHALLLRGGCGQRVPQVDAALRGVPPARRLLYVNPPRTGLEAGLAQWITAGLRPRRIAYLSCSAGTLARDLAELERGGYAVASIRPFDFFPQTRHVETLALLERRGAPPRLTAGPGRRG